jgi:hypothetical protein
MQSGCRARMHSGLGVDGGRLSGCQVQEEIGSSSRISRSVGSMSEGKYGFIKYDMVRDDDSASRHVEAPIPFMVARVT